VLKACPSCGHSRPINGGCPKCGYLPRRSLSTTARGYGAAHQSRRKQLLRLAWNTACPLCDQAMLPDQPLDLDHTVPLILNSHSTSDRIVHAHCNRSAGQALSA
jgi:hypothetical protein